MSFKIIAKKGIKRIYKINRFFYRIFFATPVVIYKKRHCAAVNEFKMYDYFEYNTHSYYPALLAKNPMTAEKIYRKVVDFDDNNLPIVKGFEQSYWPVTIAQYGLLNYNFYLTYKEETYKNKFKAVCDWLVDNISKRGIWEHNVVYHSTVVNEDILPPYASAMVQGEAISNLVRGYYLFDKVEYLECAAKALAPFLVEVKDGGVLEKIHGMSFYEEYPTHTPSLVLNGFLFSLFGLYDLSTTEHQNSKVAKRLFDEGVDTLIKVLPLYDGGFCSRYDLSYLTCAPNNNNKNPFYHAIHVNQLMAINSIIQSEVIGYYIDEWR